ncbi:MAG: NADPH-dependent FMN reductase [Pseudomonadota bacterium]
MFPMLLGICGALRAASVNRMLMREAARHYGGPFTEADIKLPLYDGDVETGMGIPDAVAYLARQIDEAEAVVIASPEYNQSIPGGLKNALDWVSRVDGAPWRGKPVAIMSAAAGRAGGARANYALRLALNPFRPRLLTGPEVLVAEGAKQFDGEARLTNERYTTALAELMTLLKAEAAQ